MRAVLFIGLLFSFLIKGNDTAMAAIQNHSFCQAQHIESKQMKSADADLGCTLIEDDIDTAEDTVLSDKARDKISSKFLVGNGFFSQQCSCDCYFPVADFCGKSAKTFANFHTSPQPIYIIHRVLRI